MKNVSVVLCTYNGARFLREQLDSVLYQTYPLYEIIIQDDGSTDETVAIITEYQAQWKVIKFFRNEAGHGVNGNFFSAIQRASGDYIAICDQDDIWERNKIELQINAIGNHLLCAGRTQPFSEDGSFVYYDNRVTNKTLLRMLYCAEIAGHTMLIKKELVQKLPTDCIVMQTQCYDLIFSVLAAAYNSIAFLDTILVHQRRYISATTYTSIEKCIPTISNGLSMFIWSLKNYKKVKELSKPVYQAWEEFLERLNIDTDGCHQAILMMKLQQSTKLSDYIRLTIFCFRHRNEILHTRGRFPQNAIRALLFPITSCYYQRGAVK